MASGGVRGRQLIPIAFLASLHGFVFLASYALCTFSVCVSGVLPTSLSDALFLCKPGSALHFCLPPLPARAHTEASSSLLHHFFAFSLILWLAGKTEHTHSLPHPCPSLSAFSSSAPFCSCVLSHCSRAADEVEDTTRREGQRARGKARVTVGAATICQYETARTARRGCVSGAAKCTGPNPPSSCRHFLFLSLFGSLLLCVFTCVCVCHRSRAY